MKLRHYSSRPLDDVYSTSQEVMSLKPKGLWVSCVEDVGYCWKSWCEGEKFRLEQLAVSHDVKLKIDAKILYIKNDEDLFALQTYYNQDLPWNGISDDLKSMFKHEYINWRGVAQDYQGIIVTPYRKRYDFKNVGIWHSAWDCSSGCVWDKSAIETVTVLRP